MPEINLPTAGKQSTILANTNDINANVNENKSTLVTVNANTSATNINLGTPTSSASSSTGANAHAKLNYINSMLGTINSNASAAAKHAGIYKINSGSSTQVTVTGKGVLRALAIEGGWGYLTLDGVKFNFGGNISFVNLPFNSSLNITRDTGSGPIFFLYDLL